MGLVLREQDTKYIRFRSIILPGWLQTAFRFICDFYRITNRNDEARSAVCHAAAAGSPHAFLIKRNTKFDIGLKICTYYHQFAFTIYMHTSVFLFIFSSFLICETSDVNCIISLYQCSMWEKLFRWRISNTIFFNIISKHLQRLAQLLVFKCRVFIVAARWIVEIENFEKKIRHVWRATASRRQKFLTVIQPWCKNVNFSTWTLYTSYESLS